LNTPIASSITYLTVAVVLALGVTAFSAVLCAALWAVFLTSLAGASTDFCTAVDVVAGAGAVVGFAAKALTEIRPAIRVAISLLISWTFQLFVKSSN
jgi:hypothetical protein